MVRGLRQASLSGSYKLTSSSEFYGTVRVVGERTCGSAPELHRLDVSSFGPEDAAIGWRSGQSIGSTDNLLDISIGRVRPVMSTLDVHCDGGLLTRHTTELERHS